MQKKNKHKSFIKFIKFQQFYRFNTNIIIILQTSACRNIINCSMLEDRDNKIWYYDNDLQGQHEYLN